MKLAARTNGSRRVLTKSGGTSLTEQHHKKACDINTIMAKYVKTGLCDHMAKYAPTFGDATGADFKAAQDLIANQKSVFNELPSQVREMFDNDPAQYLDKITSEEGIQELTDALKPKTEVEVPKTDKKTVEAKSEPPTE